MNNPQTTFLLKVELDAVQSQPLWRVRFSQYQTSSAGLGDREMGSGISCTKWSQGTRLIQKVGRNSSKAESLREAVFCVADFYSKIVRT